MSSFMSWGRRIGIDTLERYARLFGWESTELPDLPEREAVVQWPRESKKAVLPERSGMASGRH